MTTSVAGVSAPRDRAREEQGSTGVPHRACPYAEASRVLLRDSILDGMRDLLLSRDWSSITLSDVAKAAGISRQTIYNEFGSRQGLAEGYALRLADRLVDAVDVVDQRERRRHLRGLPRGVPGVLPRVGVRPAGASRC